MGLLDGGKMETESGEDVFLKLKDGEKVTFCMRGDSRQFYKKWNGKHYEECASTDANGSRGFRVNVVLKEKVDGKFVVRILDKGPQIWNQLVDLKDEGYPMDRTWVTLSRTGSGPNDTEYFVKPSTMAGPDGPEPDHKVTPSILEQISKLELHPLVKQN